MTVKPIVVVKKSRAELLAEIQAEHAARASAPSPVGKSSKKRWQEFQWMKVPLEARLDIIAVLRATPFPWRATIREIEKKHGVTHAMATSLVWSVMSCGFDDPYITGQRPLEELIAARDAAMVQS